MASDTVAVSVEQLRRSIDAAPMSRIQIRAVALTVLLSALDGYDVLSMTFAAPAIARDWGIGKAGLGLALSSGLAGMALGSFFLAPIADWAGRRRMILVSLVLMTLGSLLCATAGSLPFLVAWRLLTGLGIGTCVAVINPIAAEFANARRRPLSLALMAMGYPVGGLVGGLLASVLLRHYGWHDVFVAGFVAGAAVILLVAAALPESLSYLLARGGRDGLARINALLGKFGQPLLAAAPEQIVGGRGYAGVFAGGQRKTTIRLSVVNFLTAGGVYYLLSWLPQMVADAGFAPSDASLVSAIANLAGIGGGIALGALARRAGLNRMTVGAVAGLGIAIACNGEAPPVLPVLMLTGGICGFFAFASSAGFYATLALAFRDAVRASGSGFVIGVGRISSAAAPLITGWLFAAGLGRGAVSAIVGAAVLAGAAILATHRPMEDA